MASNRLRSTISGFELFGTQNHQRLAGYSIVNISSKSGTFSKIETSDWTGIAFVNTENQVANGTLTALNDNGAVIATSTITLGAHAKKVGLVQDLFSGNNISSATYVKFSFDTEIVGFELNGDNSSTMLDALPALIPSDLIKSTVDSLLSLLQYQDSISELTTVVSDVFSGGTGSCPVVVTDPPLTNLTSIPTSLYISADYGSGCSSSTGSTMSGKVEINVTNLLLNPTTFDLSLDYVLTATNLSENGQPLLNGSVSGHISITNSFSQIDLTANFNNFTAVGATVSGGLTASVSGLSTSGDAIDVGTGTVTFNNLSINGYTINSGTLVLTSTDSNQMTLNANLTTNMGPVNMTLVIETPTDTKMIVNTSSAGTLGSYTVTVSSLTMDTSICQDYPISGAIRLVDSSSITIVSFTNACDGTYVILNP